ncbi:ATP-binding protein [Spongiivirga sp. MCCC 1A20706]|uniref:AAA family ATPase n=1 Tax=Spongiivirga sp. MCCC 1A20706 TaxID=3160963 RepID=UPI003977548E
MASNKIVITGGPGTGKTSVINLLEEMGYTCLHEVIRTMTLEAKKLGEIADTASNPIDAVDDSLAFNKKILHQRIDQYRIALENDHELTFLDRGVPDVIAYMDFFDQEYNELFINACEQCVYDKVFILPPWEGIYISDNERFETFEEATAIYHHLVDAYKRFNFDLIEVPLLSVNKRVNFILNHLNAATS